MTSSPIYQTGSAQRSGEAYRRQDRTKNPLTTSFWKMAAKEAAANKSLATPGAAGELSNLLTLSQLGQDLAARTSARVQEELMNPTNQVEAPTLEEMLRAKYPNITYHVFDASSTYWRTRNDYPHYLLYQQDADVSALENWEPSGPNPFYGSVDGKFIAPKEIKALGSIPPGSKAVVIHPKVQQRMEEDPSYASEIMARIDAWFAFDTARNEAILPGIAARSSQCVAIGEDGSIVNAQSFSQGKMTFSTSGTSSPQAESWWELRMARHAEFMKLLVEERIDHAMQVSQENNALAAAAAAKSQLAAMLDGGELEKIFGDTIAGVPTKTVLALTRAHVWG